MEIETLAYDLCKALLLDVSAQKFKPSFSAAGLISQAMKLVMLSVRAHA